MAGPAESWDANLMHTLTEVMLVLSFLEARLVLTFKIHTRALEGKFQGGCTRF